MDARSYNGEPDDRDDALEMDRYGHSEPIRPAGCCWNDPATCLCPQCARWRLAMEVVRQALQDALKQVS